MEYLDDFDYADDLAVTAYSLENIRDTTDKVWQNTRGVGLKMNAPKTKVMRIIDTHSVVLKRYHLKCITQNPV